MNEEQLQEFIESSEPQIEDQDPEQAVKETQTLQQDVEQAEPTPPKGETVTLEDGITYDTADLEYVNGNPFVKPEARAKYEKGGAYFGMPLTDLNNQVRETLMAPGAGVADTLSGIYNMTMPGPDVKLPKFEGDAANTLRDISSVVLPGMGFGRLLQAGGAGIALTKTGRLGAFLRDPAVKWLGNQTAMLGGGAYADLAAPMNSDVEGQTALGSAKEHLPRWFGWVPDNLVVMEGDSPDVVRGKNMTEGAGFGFFSSLLEGLGALARGVGGMNSATKYVPKSEGAEKYFSKNQPTVAVTPEEAVDASAFRREVDLDEVGDYNMYKTVRDGVNPEEAIIFGKDKDLFSFGESGIRSTDEMGIVGDAVDLARIEGNIDTVYGRLRNPMSEAALRFTLDGNEVVPRIMQSLGDQLKAAGDFDYSTTTGKLINNKTIKDAGDRLAADMMGMNVNQLKSTLRGFLQLREGLPVLNKTGKAAVTKTINSTLSQLADLDQLKAYAYVDTAFAGQVSDFAQGIRLNDGTESMLRAQEQMIDRLEYLMDLRGTTAYAKNSMQRARSTWQRLTGASKMSSDQKYAASIAEQLKGEFDGSLEALEAIQADTRRFMNSLRELAAERPNFLKPMATVYELTDGSARSVGELNNYLRNKFGVLNKAFIDGQPEIPSAVMEGFWATAFNSALSGLKTPLKAGVGNLSTWVFKPTSHVIGAFLNGNSKDMTRAFYAYGNVMDTVAKSGDYAKKMWTRSAQDPYALRGRDEILRRSDGDMDLLKQVADSAALEGNDGPSVMFDIVKTQKDIAEHPWLRIGNRAMGTEDAWLTAVNGQMVARTRAYDEITKGGTIPFDKDLADKTAKKVYEGMFDENGVIRDPQVLRQTAQATFSQNNALSTGFQDMMQRIPLLRPFFMFTRTPVNSLSYGASFEPVGMFIDKVNKFEKPFDQMPGQAVERLLKEEGMDMRVVDQRAEYTRLRDEYKGRSALGASFVSLAVYGYLSGNITGRAGYYDTQKQKARRKLGWKPMTAFGVDYSQIPAVSDWVSLTIDIMDNASVMEPTDVAGQLRAMAYVFGANILERTQLQNIEQFSDVLKGDPAAINRWASNTAVNSQLKVSGMLGTMNQLMAPQLKAVENQMIPLVLNRLPGKPTLSDKYDAIDGGKVNELGNPLHRLYNAVSPFPYHERPSPVKEYLADVQYPFEMGASTRYDGATYTKTEQEEINRLMGEDGYFRREVKKIMKQHPAADFRERFNEARKANLDPSASDLDLLHNKLDSALSEAKARAEAEMPELMKRKQDESNDAKIKRSFVKQGDIEGGRRFLEQAQQQSY